MNLAVCPFNKAHVMPKSSLQTHIIKCMKNYPDHFVCLFNSQHRFLNREEYLEHSYKCPDKMKDSSSLEKSQQQGLIKQQPGFLPDVRKFSFENENWEQ